MMCYKSYRWAGAALTAIGLFVTTVTGQPPLPPPASPIEAAKTQKSIAQQKAEAQADADVRQAIENATNQAKREDLKPKAIQALKTAKSNLRDAVGLTDEARTRLTGLLDAKIAVIEGRAGTTTVTGTATYPSLKLDPKAYDVKTANARATAAAHAELKDVKLGIERIRDYELNGQTALANAEIARLQKAYPDNPAVLPLGYNDTIRNRLADSVAYANEANSRWVANQKNINESALPAIRDVEFPKDWKEKSTRAPGCPKAQANRQGKEDHRSAGQADLGGLHGTAAR